jgi:hypothetical protein
VQNQLEKVDKRETRVTSGCHGTQMDKRETRAMGAAGGANKRADRAAMKVSPAYANHCSSGLDFIALVILSCTLISQSETESYIGR